MILVVDDDADLREALCDAVRDTGREAIGAAHGRAALEVMRGPRGGDVRLVLLDLMMPVMDGWEFRREQQADPALARVPVVVMTAAANLAAHPVAAHAVLRKPVSAEQLFSALDAALGRAE